MTEDEMAGWHHRLDGHEFEQTSGDGDGQGSLVCCSPRGRKESDMIEHTTTLEFLSSEKGKDNDIQFLTQEVVMARHGGFLEAGSVRTCLCVLCVCVYVVVSMCVSVSQFPHFIRTSFILD